ncbi:hypothetical protein L0F63_004098 [Massospora cicadina]|nr:hypothetical protein L0F63_004098 [Massospora cicadina]
MLPFNILATTALCLKVSSLILGKQAAFLSSESQFDFGRPFLKNIQPDYNVPRFLPFQVAENMPYGDTSHRHATTNLRFHIVLEAQTAAAQKPEELPLTYLNKSQYYAITLADRSRTDAVLTTTLSIKFFDDCHRKMAGTYWGFWLSQQPSPRIAKALVLDKGGSAGVVDCDLGQFDRATIKWIGRSGARILVKFNCLSTDFSRIKGVKGIPMRVCASTENEHSFCKVKLFRDKGAERKNKDDQRHLEKIWDKMKGKLEDHPLLHIFAPASPITEFLECTKDSLDMDRPFIFPPESDDSAYPIDSSSLRERRFDTLSGADISDLLDVDPAYIPHLRKPRPMLCLFVKLFNESVYRAVYLEKPTVMDLVEKLSSKLQLQASSISSLTRITPRGLEVQVDDAMVSQMVDEMDIVVECSFHPETNHMALILKY